MREWCEPGELVREAVAMSGLKESAVRINIAKNLPTISVDAHLIQQALGALLSNAAGHARNDQPIEVNAARDDSMLVISVADHGPGLAPGEENKVFEKFYRGPGTAPRRSRPWPFHRAPAGRSARRRDRRAKSRRRRRAIFYSSSHWRTDAIAKRSDRVNETGRAHHRR